MSYEPNNTSTYLAAFTGCMAAITADQVGNGDANYDNAAEIADAFAQAVDTLLEDAPTAAEVQLFFQISQSTWTGRSQLPSPACFDPNSYVALATAVVAAAASGIDQIVAEGIDPNSTAGASTYTNGLALTLIASGDNFIPTEAGKYIFAAEITPTASGKVDVDVNLNINSDTAGDQISILLAAIPDLTAITGGSNLTGAVPFDAIKKIPTSTTPPASDGSAILLNVFGGQCVTESGQHNCSLTSARVRVQLPVGVRAGIVAFGASVNNVGSKWVASGSITISEVGSG